MKKYEIHNIRKPFDFPIIVEANSPKEAVEKALNTKAKRDYEAHGDIVVYGGGKSFVYEVQR